MNTISLHHFAPSSPLTTFLRTLRTDKAKRGLGCLTGYGEGRGVRGVCWSGRGREAQSRSFATRTASYRTDATTSWRNSATAPSKTNTSNTTSPSRPNSRSPHIPPNCFGSTTSFNTSPRTFPPHQTRTFSSTTQNSAWSLWRPKSQRKPVPPNKEHAPPLASFLEDNGGPHGLGRVTRPTNELKLRCTELDENGNVTLVSGEFKKSELIAKYGLLPRDLRKIDSSLLPHILVRPSAILINLLHLRVLIKHNRVLVFDAYGTTDSYSQSVFMYDLDLKLRQKDSPANGTLAYEFRALEAVLISVTLGLESEFEGVSEPVVKVLRELEETIDRDKLRHLLIYSKKLGTFEQKARLVRDALTELLEADDDLSAMYLSEKAAGRVREDDDHTEVEMLLESYHKVADEIVQAAENLVSSIRNTEEIVKAILDANRNSLMLLDLKFSILTLAITAGTFIAALYGMNLKNFIEESDFGFFGVSAWCTVFGFIVAVYGLNRLRRVQRVSMWGHGGGGGGKGNAWGLGAWGGRSLDDGSSSTLGRLRAGHDVMDVLKRERQVARRLARAEKEAEEGWKGP